LKVWAQLPTNKNGSRGGVEPDGCFYVQNAARIIGHRIDLKTDPPPDIVIEVDISHESTSKLAIYAGMGVPELWRYDGRRVHIYQLLEQRYVEVAASNTFPMITNEVLLRFLEQNKLEGQTAVLRSFREWLRVQTA
jgi:Uma2 family endonuclease